MARSFVVAVMLALAANVASAQSNEWGSRPLPRFGYFVIGPDSQAVRSWTATWIEARLAASSEALPRHVMPWREFLEVFLDTQDYELAGRQEPAEADGGPSALDATVYPWDLRKEASVSEMRALMRLARLGRLSQVVIRPDDSGYVLSVIQLDSASQPEPWRVSVRASRLRLGADSVGTILAAHWSAALPSQRAR